MTTSLGAGPRKEKERPGWPTGIKCPNEARGWTWKSLKLPKGSLPYPNAKTVRVAFLDQMRFMDRCNGPGGEFDDGRCMNLGGIKIGHGVGKENSTAGDADPCLAM